MIARAVFSEDRPVLPRTTLVLGGARSGKSRFAETLALEACANAEKPLYLATGQAFDPEMAERIALHQAARAENWDCLEEPFAVSEQLQSAALAGRTVLLDCLTLWLSNLMLDNHDLTTAFHQLCVSLDHFSGRIILVSNEVGTGIVPENKLSRQFRDEAGRLNRMIATQAQQVYLVTAGLPLLLKDA